MAYVVRRVTKAGAVSTALVESYRDEQGRPRQRLLANLHGEPNTSRGLARLAVRRTKLLAERKEMASGKAIDDETGEVVDAALAKKVIAHIDAKLADLAREQAIIKKQCPRPPRKLGPPHEPMTERSKRLGRGGGHGRGVGGGPARAGAQEVQNQITPHGRPVTIAARRLLCARPRHQRGGRTSAQ